MPSSWKGWYCNLSHQSFDSSYGIIYNFWFLRRFLSYSTGHSFWYFCTSRRHGFLPNYTFLVLHTYPLFLFSSTMLWTAWYLSLKYLHVLFAVFCLPSVFLWTFWLVTVLSIHRNGEHISDAGLGASLLGEFWLIASLTWMDICGKNYSEISPKLYPYWYRNYFVKQHN